MQALDIQISSRNVADKTGNIIGNWSQCEEVVHSHSNAEKKSWPQHSGTLKHSNDTNLRTHKQGQGAEI